MEIIKAKFIKGTIGGIELWYEEHPNGTINWLVIEGDHSTEFGEDIIAAVQYFQSMNDGV